MKRLIMTVMSCIAVCVVWGRSVSLDLRAPLQESTRKSRQVMPLPAKVDGVLRSFDLNAGAAKVGAVAVGDELVFMLFDDVELTLTLKKKIHSPLCGDVFLAEASGYEGVKNAVVLCTVDGLTADIQDYFKKRMYKVLSTPNGVRVLELEAKGGTCGCDTRVPPSPARTTSTKPHKAKKIVDNNVTELDETCVDILVAYDENAAIWARSNGGGVTNFAQMAVQRMNTVLANNGLDVFFRFRLVGIEEVPASSSDLDFVLDAVTEGEGNWASVQRVRNEVGADIVTVLVDTGTAYGTTGLGWSLKEEEDLESFSEYAYNVCAIRSVAQSHTMTHEVGHNMGAGHSDVQETQPGPQLYGYSAGYYFSAEGENYHTIMAYDGEGPGGDEVPYFSSPDSTYKGVVVGDDKHDNRLTLRNTYAAVAQWRDANKGSGIDGADDVPSGPLEWLTSRDEVFARARAEGKNIFLISGRDSCGNTMGTRNNSCEDPSVKGYLFRDYVCWYNNCDTQYEESLKYFSGYNIGNTLPFIAVIDAIKDETLVAEGGYHYANDLRLMLGTAAKSVAFSPESGTLFNDAIQVVLTAQDGGAIYYTLDGTMPNEMSMRYEGPITLNSTAKIRAAAFVDGKWSLPAEANFTKTCTETIGRYEWIAHVVDGGCVLVSATPKLAGFVSIPAEIGGYDVLEIADNAFESCNGLSTVVIPESVELIGWDAFSYCGSNFTDAWIPEHLKYDEMAYDSFYNWDYAIELHYYSHAPVFDTASVTFDANGGTIGGEATTTWAIYDGERLDSADEYSDSYGLPTPMFDGYAFLGWYTAVEGGEVVDADTVVTGDMTFYAHWEKIGYTYNYIDNGDGTATLSGYDEYGNWVGGISPSPLGDFTLPEEIDGKRIVAVDNGVFYGYGLKSVIIPACVTNLTVYAFSDAYDLANITVAIDNPAYKSIDGILYTKDGKTLVCCPRAKEGGVSVAPGTECVGENAFYNNGKLTSVSFPEGLRAIEWYAFADCWNVAAISLPSSINVIGVCAFAGLNIQTVTIPASVSLIDECAFMGCPFLESVTFIGDRDAVEIRRDAFAGTPYLSALPFKLLIDDGWLYGFEGVVPSEVVIPDTVWGISESLFDADYHDVEALTSVTIPASVEEIYAWAFYGCGNLATVIFEGDIGDIRFDDGLTSAFEDTPWLDANYPVPANDEFENAEQLEGVSGNVAGQNYNAHCWNLWEGGVEVDAEPLTRDYRSYRTVWYAWTAPEDGIVLLNAADATFGTVLGVYVGDTVDGLETVAENHDAVSFVAKAGDTYHMAVGGEYNCDGCFTLEWDVVEPLENDNFADALTIEGAEGTVDWTNVGATYEADDPLHAMWSSANTVWYSWTAPMDGEVVFDTIGSDFDTVLGVYAGDAIDSLAVIAENDDAGDSSTSLVSFMAEAGVSYRIAVGGCGGVTGSIKLNWHVDDGTFKIVVDADGIVTGFYGECPTEITAADWPEGVTGIGSCAFSEPSSAANLQSVVLPDSVASIDRWAFEDCTNLVSVSVGNPVIKIEGSAFSGCTRLASINVENVGHMLVGWDLVREYYPTMVRWCDQYDEDGNWVGSGHQEYEPTAVPIGMVVRVDNIEPLVYGMPTDALVTNRVWYADDEYVDVVSVDTNLLVGVWAMPAWDINKYTLTFDAAGGSAVAPVTQNYGTAVTAPTAPMRRGYAFVGWEPAIPATMPAENMTLTAQWTANRYSVTFDANGGNGTMAAQSFVYDEEQHLAECAFERAAHEFLGWSLAADSDEIAYFGGENVLNMTAAADGNLTLYAVWERTTLWAPVAVADDGSPGGGSSGGAESGDEMFDGAVAETYDGYVYAEDGVLKGTVQVKAAKAKVDGKTEKTLSKITVTIQLAGEKKVTARGNLDVATARFDSKIGERALTLYIGANGLTGTYGEYCIDGAQNKFTTKDAADKKVGADALARWQGVYTVARKDAAGWSVFSLTVASKGKVKVQGVFADGTKVSATGQLLVGESGVCAIPVVVAKRTDVAFNVWLTNDGVEAVGLSGEVAVGRLGVLANGTRFAMDAAAFSALLGDGTYANYLPDGLAVSQSGTKLVVADGAKAGKVQLVRGAASPTDVDGDKAGANPSALKLTYTAKTGIFKGTFKAYALVNGKPKATTVTVTGVLVDGVGYGAATIKKVGGVPVTIE